MIAPTAMIGKMISATSSMLRMTMRERPFSSCAAVFMLILENMMVSSGTSTTPVRNVISLKARFMQVRWPAGSELASILSTMWFSSLTAMFITAGPASSISRLKCGSPRSNDGLKPWIFRMAGSSTSTCKMPEKNTPHASARTPIVPEKPIVAIKSANVSGKPVSCAAR